LLAGTSIAVGHDTVQLDRLEASHVAEIHTGGVSEKIELESLYGMPVYIIRSRRGAMQYRVEVHGVHGRLLAIDELQGGQRQPVYRWPGVRVVAHRGGAQLGPPENTIPAIEKAIEVGADLIEIDIRQTADGHLVLMHDATVDRTTNGSGRVDELTLAEMKLLEIQHDGSDDIRVPTLDEALEVMKGKIDPDLDFKEGELQPLLTVVRRLGITEQSTMHAPWERCLQVVQEEPRIRIRPTADYPQQVPAMIRQLRPAIVNLDWHAVTQESVRLAHLGGCHAFVNCLGSADAEFYIGEAIDIGADYIQSDRPALVVKILTQRELRQQLPPRGDPLGTPLRADRLYPLR
jgi:glycerophosphoryl diester phosphodiesterase